jgi:hypothetical protein
LLLAWVFPPQSDTVGGLIDTPGVPSDAETQRSSGAVATKGRTSREGFSLRRTRISAAFGKLQARFPVG